VKLAYTHDERSLQPAADFLAARRWMRHDDAAGMTPIHSRSDAEQLARIAQDGYCRPARIRIAERDRIQLGEYAAALGSQAALAMLRHVGEQSVPMKDPFHRRDIPNLH
jgi:hypothetical protein